MEGQADCDEAAKTDERTMIVGVPRETYPGERRVAVVPGVVPALTKAGLSVLVEAGAGEACPRQSPTTRARCTRRIFPVS